MLRVSEGSELGPRGPDTRRGRERAGVVSDHRPARDTQTVRKFTGTYRGIRYEMNELDKGHAFESAYLPRVHWCGYVWLDVSRLADAADRAAVTPKAVLIGTVSGRYSFTPGDTIWNDAPFHGGCSFVDMIQDPTPGRGPHIKAGCDWNHLWDSEAGFYGDAASVEHNCCQVIDWLLERFPVLAEGAKP